MVAQPNSLAGRDIASVIHPYTNLEQHKVVGPTVIARGEGSHVYDDGGKRYLEARDPVAHAAFCRRPGVRRRPIRRKRANTCCRSR